MTSVDKLPVTFKTLWSLGKVRNIVDKPFIDNPIFRLHYRITTVIFFACFTLVTLHDLIGKPMECLGSNKEENKDELRIKAINTFCNLGNTYTLPQNQHKNGKLNGIGPQNSEERKYDTYYQWVPIMMLIQGTLFYVPHWIWKNWEHKKIDNLTKTLRGPLVDLKFQKEKMTKILAKYAFDSLHTHNMYFLVYFSCEILNFINVIFNIYATNKFLNGQFMKYGLEVLEFTDIPQESRTDPMIEIFSRVAKCEFQIYGPSGTSEKKDYLCILSVNNINEKIYIFLWFWFSFLVCVSVLPILHNVAVFTSPLIREMKLKRYVIIPRKKSKIGDLVRKTQIGDFFLWDLLGKNLNSKCYCDFIKELHALLIIREMTELDDLEDNQTDANSLQAINYTIFIQKLVSS